MKHAVIDMSRASWTYAAAVVLTVVLAGGAKWGRAQGLVPAFDWPVLALAALGCTVVAGMATALLHIQRTRMPWRVPQARVALVFLIAIAAALTAIALAK